MEERLFEISFEITGVTPLLMNAFTDAAQMAATDGTRSAITGDKGSPREQAAKKLYRSGVNPEVIIIPQPNIFRCILDAGKYIKAGKSKITTMRSSLIPSCLDLPGVEFPLHYNEPWQVDTRPVRIPSTGGRILAHRPSFYDWSLKVDATLDTLIIGTKTFRDLVDKAGRAIGLGDFRPDCKGPFGKFKVTHWEEHEMQLLEAA